MYDLVPTKELAMELMSCPLTPKSHSLISPLEFTRMLDGFTSVRERCVCVWWRGGGCVQNKMVVHAMSHPFSIKWSLQHGSMGPALASVYDLVDISEVLEALQHLNR